MKMLQVKSEKNTYRYRLDWIVSWCIVHEPAKGKKPETWRVKLEFIEAGNYQLSQGQNWKAIRWFFDHEFDFDNEADAMASVSVVDI